jgi:hypothetical protein
MTTVRVRDPFKVSLNGTTYSPGDVVEVPPSVAASWLQHGWVTEKTPAKEAAPKKAAG